MGHQPDSLAALLRHYRRQAGLSQRRLAELSTLSVRTIWDLEHGRATKPRPETIRLLVRGLRLKHGQRVALEIAAGRVVASEDLDLIRDLPPTAPPARITALVGREAEVRTVVDLVVSRSGRWIGVVGLAGVGKTQLALEVAMRLHLGHGYSVLWIGSDGRGPETALAARTRNLLAGADDDVAELIGDRDTLVVADDPAVSDSGVGRLDDLLQRNPRTSVLTTSKIPLGASAEQLVPLAPLPVPASDVDDDLAELAAVPSVRVLVQYVRQMRPEFRLDGTNAQAVAALCRALDGLPSALRLAAQWSTVHPPRQFLRKLRQEPATLLSPPEGAVLLPDVGENVTDAVRALDAAPRRLLDELMTFDGDWSVEDVVEFARASPSTVANGVHELLVRGLVRRSAGVEDTRFHVLNLVRLVCGRPSQNVDDTGEWPSLVR